MSRSILTLLFALSLIFAGCTPTITNTQDDTNGKSTDQQNGSTTGTPKPTDGKAAGEVSYNEYKNPAMGYSVNIPTTWYWRHYHKGELGADSLVDDYVFISPTHAITSLGTESPAEITIEVSHRPLSDFVNSSLTEKPATIGGQTGVVATGVINNQVFTNFQQIEYRFTKDGKTFRLVYLADAGLSNNEKVFEAIVASFKFF